MEFNNNKPIYLQIIDKIVGKIISGEYVSGDKMLSIRDLSKLYTVNQNTVMKSMKELELANVLVNRRGIGYFVTEDKEIIRELKKNKIKETIRNFLYQMKLSGFTKKKIIEIIEREG